MRITFYGRLVESAGTRTVKLRGRPSPNGVGNVSEAVYVRDDDTGELWSPTALPIRLEGSTYVARHAYRGARRDAVRWAN